MMANVNCRWASKRMLIGILTAVVVVGIMAVIGSGRKEPDMVDDGVVMGNDLVADNLQTVSYSYSNANMELQLPAEWDYEIEEYKEDSSYFGIRFWPNGLENGKISLLYYGNMFAVCGTGLSTKEIAFENGLQASVGIYDNDPVWSYMGYRDTPGSYVVFAGMDKTQWKEYGDAVMTILGNVKLAEGILWENQAIALAKPKCTENYDSANGNYDFKTGVWKIRFYNEYKAGKEQNIWINPQGEVIKDFLD